ncbi:hypothetical protein METBIDRAFT_17281, partial [Metschnikowia bicuspidata var. bicuspidata NRRL YB-4993]
MPSSILGYKSIAPHLNLPDSHTHRKYELVHMPSGLRCLLINDSSSHMVSVSMTVGCGSFQDPDEIHGLAHLCEHLIVLGGPQTRLRHVVSNSGGSMNAYTGSDQTSFAFEISSYAEDSLNVFIMDSMLPVFASYFSKLKFTSASIGSESRAVHEEHMLNTSNIEKILWHGLRLLTRDSHPFSRFATGNLATLSEAPTKLLKAKLVSYHAHNFRPENMALVIKGPQSTNHLKKVVAHHFSGKKEMPSILSSSGLTNPSKNACVFDEMAENILFIKSEVSPRIRLCFPFCEDDGPFVSTTQTLLCNIIGNESVDSLCYQLKKTTQLAENVFVHTQEICKESSVLLIDIEATNQGMRRIQVVLGVVLLFLENTLVGIADSELESIIDEYQIVDQVQFKSKKIPASLLEEVVAYSEYLQRNTENIQGIVKGEAGGNKTGSLEMKQTIRNRLCRNRLLVQILSPSFLPVNQFEGPTPVFCEDKYFGFEYTKLRYDFSGLPEPSLPAIKVPRPIGKLAQKVSFLVEAKTQSPATKYRDLETAREQPVLWAGEDSLQIWSHHLADSRDIEISAHVKLSLVAADAESLVGVEIMASIVGEKLQFILYNLESLGCSWAVHVNVNGEPSLMLTAGGPSTLVHEVLSTMVEELVTCLGSMHQCSYQQLKRARVLLRRTYEEYVNATGVKLVFVMASVLFDEGLVLPAQRIKALELIDIESVAALGHCVLAGPSFTSVLVSGNAGEPDLSKVRDICGLVGGNGVSKPLFHPESSFLLPRGECCTLQVAGPSGDPLAVVYYYIQMGERSSLTTYVLAKLVELVISAFAFEDLRMKRNLAYGIFTGMRMFKKTFGIHITVPTASHSCSFLVEQIEEFLTTLEQIIDSFSEQQYARLVQDLAKSTDELAGDDTATTNLFSSLQPVNGSSGQGNEDEHTIHWNNLEQILNKTYNFGGKACEERIDHGVLAKITLQQFRHFFRQKVSVSSPHRSVVAIS